MSRPLRVSAGTPVVIDTSVAFKWFDTSEYGADVARDLRQAHGRDDVALCVPAHLPLEIINALVCRHASLDAAEGAIAGLAEMDLLIAPVDDTLLRDAARIAHDEGIALYDAAFIGLAAVLDTELVTADRKQAATRACRVRYIGE